MMLHLWRKEKVSTLGHPRMTFENSILEAFSYEPPAIEASTSGQISLVNGWVHIRKSHFSCFCVFWIWYWGCYFCLLPCIWKSFGHKVRRLIFFCLTNTLSYLVWLPRSRDWGKDFWESDVLRRLWRGGVREAGQGRAKAKQGCCCSWRRSFSLVPQGSQGKVWRGALRHKRPHRVCPPLRQGAAVVPLSVGLAPGHLLGTVGALTL